MSKSISFGFGKSKVAVTSTQPSAPKTISFSSTGKSAGGSFPRNSKATLHEDSDDDEEPIPKHEAVTGFSTSGAILGQPKRDKEERIIENPGNADWRRRGRKNLLPSEVQAQQNGSGLVMVERNEVSTASGLQFVGSEDATKEKRSNGATQTADTEPPPKDLTEDERAIAALLDDGSGKSRSNIVIETRGNIQLQNRDETSDFREDVAMRPDSSTLEEYASMPVEEFGMAMLRGMGKKRRANGEVINFENTKDDEKNANKRQRKQEGFLGIGAKPAPGLQGVELGAWGKADMRKNNKGEGFFTPVMIEDKRTGERITEEEFERRKQDVKNSSKINGKGEDWRERRDRNLERDGRDKQFSGSSRKGDRGYESSRSRDDREKYDRDYDSSKSRRKRERSRSREGRRYEKDDYDDRYDSGSSRRSGHRDRDRDYHRNEDRDRDGDRHKDRDRYRGSDRDDRRHRDRR